MPTKLTKKDVLIAPRQEGLISRFHSAKSYSKLDVRIPYFHITIEEEDRHKTVLKFEKKLYQYSQMCIGLTNAVAVSNSLMKKVFSNDNRKLCRVVL